jgi:hypothetical protein
VMAVASIAGALLLHPYAVSLPARAERGNYGLRNILSGSRADERNAR